MTKEHNNFGEGKIIWFSGIDKNKNRKNNFGFIDDPDEGDIFFHRSEILSDEDLSILDSDSNPSKAKGIIVNYKLKYNHKKNSKDACQVSVTRLIDISTSYSVTIKEFYIRSLGYKEKYEPIKELTPYSIFDKEKLKALVAELDLSEFIELTQYLINKEAEQYIPEFLDDFIKSMNPYLSIKEIINQVFVANPTCLNVCSYYLTELTQKSCLSIASSDWFSEINLDVGNCIIYKIITQKSNSNFQFSKFKHHFLSRLAQKSEYWNYLSLEELSYIYSHEKESITNSYQFLQIVIDRLNYNKEAIYPQVWETIYSLREYVEYHGELWDIAPDFIKVDIIRKRYQKFLQIVDNWKNYRPKDAQTTRFSCDQVYQFTDSDRELANTWAGNGKQSSSFIKSMMFSARGAEKAAINHYQARGYQVIDTAIQQVEGLAEDWKSYDLKVKSSQETKYIDVKNARSAYSNKNRFSEFCVPTFKQRDNKDIIILGIFSPYLANLPEEHESNENIKILGEVTETFLKKLQGRCRQICSQLDITVKKNSQFNKKGYLSESLPIWAFDFDDSFYEERLQIEGRFRSLTNEEVPPLSDLKLLNLYPLSLALSATLSFPLSWQQELSQSEQRFAEILDYLVSEEDYSSSGNEIKVVKLPHIFLAILTHFLENCLNQDSSFSPSLYKKMLFTDSSYTMGVYDPMSFIYTTCNILETIWNKSRKDLLNFSHFKFDSRGLLQGQETKTQKYKTILAYCGGWTKNEKKRINVPCGNRPLYIGHHRNCPVCQRLICDQCGYCDQNCSRNYKSNTEK